MRESSTRNTDQPTERDTRGLVPIVFGVTGHRDIPPEDVPKLEAAVINQLKCIETNHSSSPKVLLTGLAEGADRLVARCALELGWSLGAVLALPIAEFEKDFETETSLAEFRDLLGRCAWVREVAPAGCSRPECYELVGDWVSIHAQWLIAFWDGTQTGKKGGTGYVVKLFREGRSTSRPVLPDTGPVIQIVTRRQSDVSAIPLRDVGEVKRLMPNPLGMGRKEHEKHEEERWTKVLSLINAFNKSAVKHRKHDLNITVAREHLNRNQPLPDAALPCSAWNASWLFAYADYMAGRLQRTRVRLFLFILALSIFGLGFEKYYSGPADGLGWSAAGWLLGALICGAVALLLAKFPIFFRETDYMDYRSLAEACRVQYFWKRAGINLCAAEFHLFDQRDELEWIRQAVRTTELGPSSSPPPQGEELLKSVRDCWITDQKGYYWTQYKKHERHAKFQNALALWLFCLAGLVILVAIGLQVSGDNVLVKWLPFSYGSLLTLSATIKVYLFWNGHEEHAVSFLRMWQSMEVAERNVNEGLDGHSDRSDICAILRDVGKAALEENSDWLLLHRDRLIKPPIS